MELSIIEAETMASIQPHPNILRLVSFEKLGQEATLLATPLATGGDSLKLMQQRNLAPLPETDARGLFSQLMSGIKYLHDTGIVHRDIKCENLLLTGAQRRSLVIADFGFAAKWKKGEKSLSEPWGSLHYSSPEICTQAPSCLRIPSLIRIPQAPPSPTRVPRSTSGARA